MKQSVHFIPPTLEKPLTFTYNHISSFTSEGKEQIEQQVISRYKKKKKKKTAVEWEHANLWVSTAATTILHFY